MKQFLQAHMLLLNDLFQGGYLLLAGNQILEIMIMNFMHGLIHALHLQGQEVHVVFQLRASCTLRRILHGVLLQGIQPLLQGFKFLAMAFKNSRGRAEVLPDPFFHVGKFFLAPVVELINQGFRCNTMLLQQLS